MKTAFSSQLKQTVVGAAIVSAAIGAGVMTLATDDKPVANEDASTPTIAPESKSSEIPYPSFGILEDVPEVAPSEPSLQSDFQGLPNEKLALDMDRVPDRNSQKSGILREVESEHNEEATAPPAEQNDRLSAAPPVTLAAMNEFETNDFDSLLAFDDGHDDAKLQLLPPEAAVIATQPSTDNITGMPDLSGPLVEPVGQTASDGFAGPAAIVPGAMAQTEPAPGQAMDSFSQHYPVIMANGVEIGAISVRVDANGSSLHLKSFLSLFQSKMDPDLYTKLASAPASDSYVSLTTLADAGINLDYNASAERIKLSTY